MQSLEEIFPSRLKAYMDLSGMGAEQLARETGCSVDAVRKYMSGSMLPQFKTAFRLAQALGCTPNDLCGISLDAPSRRDQRKAGAAKTAAASPYAEVDRFAGAGQHAAASRRAVLDCHIGAESPFSLGA